MGAYRGGSPLRSAVAILRALIRGAKAFDSVMPLAANPRVFDRYRMTLTLSLVACEGGRATFVLITSWHD